MLQMGVATFILSFGLIHYEKIHAFLTTNIFSLIEHENFGITLHLTQNQNKCQYVGIS